MKLSMMLLLFLVFMIFAGIGSATQLGIPSGTTFDLNDSILRVGNISNQGNLQCGVGSFIVSGDWINSGIFNAGTGTVEFDGALQNITGSSTYYNLTAQTPGQNLSFEAGSTQTIQNLLIFSGSAGNPVVLRSISSPAQWKIDPASYEVIRVHVKDSNNINASSIIAANSIDSGNNINWIFGPALAAIILRDKESGNPNFTRSRTVSLEATGVSLANEMIRSENPAFTGAAWGSFINPYDFDITSPSDGSKEVYYKVRNASLDESPVLHASILLDTVEPSIPTLESPANGSTIDNPMPTLSWEAATDNLSGIGSYEILLDNSAITIDAASSYSIGTPLPLGLHSWEVSAGDRAGNWGGFSSTWDFTVVTTTTTVTTTSSSTTTTTFLAPSVGIDGKNASTTDINTVTIRSSVTASLLLNGQAIKSSIISELIDSNNNAQVFYSNSNKDYSFNFPLPEILAGNNYTLKITFDSDYGNSIFAAPIKRQEEQVKIMTSPTTPLKGAILNIDFVAKTATTLQISIFNVTTGVLVHSDNFNAQTGLNNYSWADAKNAAPGQYMLEIRDPSASQPPIWRYFFVGKYSN